MIQFAINKAYFLQALHTTRRAISSKNAIPILSTIKIEVTSDGIYLTGSNGQISIENSISVSEENAGLLITQPGSILLEANFFINVVSSLPDVTLTFEEIEQYQVLLKSGKSEITLKGKDVEAVLAKLYPKFEAEKFHQMCEEYQIPLDKFIKEYSTGMKAKLNLIIALTHQAEFLMLDEPTAGLDVGARERMLDILREYMEEEPERSILISSHISSDLEHLCDDIYVIHKGKIVLHEAMDTILEKYAVLKVSEEQYQAVDKRYLLKEKKEFFGVACLTNEKQYYIENYPEIVVESGSLDQVILMLTGGER